MHHNYHLCKMTLCCYPQSCWFICLPRATKWLYINFWWNDGRIFTAHKSDTPQFKSQSLNVWPFVLLVALVHHCVAVILRAWEWSNSPVFFFFSLTSSSQSIWSHRQALFVLQTTELINPGGDFFQTLCGRDLNVYVSVQMTENSQSLPVTGTIIHSDPSVVL